MFTCCCIHTYVVQSLIFLCCSFDDYLIEYPMLIAYAFAFVLFLQSQPVEDFYRSRGKLLEFDLPGGIPESWPKLLQVLSLDDYEEKQSAAA